MDTGVSTEPIEVRESRGEIQSNQNDPIMETGQVGEACLTPSQHQTSLDTESNERQSRKILKDIANNSMKNRLKHNRKKKEAGGGHLSPGGKENIIGGEELKGMHEVIVQGESRGGWKRISRDILIGASPSSHPLLSGIKRGGMWADFEHAVGSGQKKSRGEDTSAQSDLDVSNRRRTP